MRNCSSPLLTLICILSLSVSTSGCKPKEPPPPPSGSALVESIKASLNAVVETGEGGSALDVLRSDFDRYKEEAPEKAAAIEPDFNELMTAATPEKRKELATKIQGELSN